MLLLFPCVYSLFTHLGSDAFMLWKVYHIY